MKKVLKEIKNVETIEVWESVDGNQFDNQEECRKYERSAKGLMRSKIAKLTIKSTKNTSADAWDVMGGMDDHDLLSVKMENLSDLETVLQFILLSSPYYCNNEEKWDKIAHKVEKAYENGDMLLFGINCDGEYYFINSIQNIIKNLNLLCEKEDGSEDNIQK